MQLQRERPVRRVQCLRVDRCKLANWVMASVGLLLLAMAVQSQGERAPGAFFVAVPLFTLQVLLGVIPALACLRTERLVRSARWWLLVPTIGGPMLSAAAAAVSLLTYGGC